MKAAQHMLAALARQGVDACFANPGTSEMHLVAALDAAPSIRPVLCLFEGVATGAADGYGRMAEKPALTLLHLGPGLGNGFANLHNAYRARTPIVSMVGEHATYHRINDAPLATDIAAIAKPVSYWMETVEQPEKLTSAALGALEAAKRLGPAALILPADVAWSDAEPEQVRASGPEQTDAAWQRHLDKAAALLRAGDCTLMIGGRKLTARASAAAKRIADKTGARLFVETFPARMERGGDTTALSRLPYLAEMAAGMTASSKSVVLAGTKAPVAFFALPGRPTRLSPESAETLSLVAPGQDPEAALEALAEAVGASKSPTPTDKPNIGVPNTDSKLDTLGLAQALASTLPANAIVSDESVTLGLNTFDFAAAAPPHDWMMLTGGSIGQGLPLATGAAVACRDRRVVALQADGSALYTIQALWTQAREGLNVTNVILSNRAYAILSLELMRTGVTDSPKAARDLFDLARPEIDFTRIAGGFGVPAQRVHTVHELAEALRRAHATPGPSLIEAVFP